MKQDISTIRSAPDQYEILKKAMLHKEVLPHERFIAPDKNQTPLNQLSNKAEVLSNEVENLAQEIEPEIPTIENLPKQDRKLKNIMLYKKNAVHYKDVLSRNIVIDPDTTPVFKGVGTLAHEILPEIPTLEGILDQYEIQKKIFRRKGDIDPNKMKVNLNPAFDMIETLAHEVLHPFYMIVLRTLTSERYVRIQAKKLVKKEGVPELMSKYIENAKYIPSNTILGTIGM
mgnify:CR=1 FL=1